MKLIRKLIEDAAVGAVGAGDVAAASTPLFAGLSKRSLPIKLRVSKREKAKKQPWGGKSLGLGEAYHHISEGDDAFRRGSDSFDATSVIAKLKSIENKNAVSERDSQAFVLEDDDGNAVKVWVRVDQAANFEAALNALLSDVDEEQRQTVPEIAEILYRLKDNFDIVDIQWPEVQEDEEEDQTLAAPEGGIEGVPGEEGGLDDGSASPDDLAGLEDPAADVGGGDGDVKGLLTQIIDMMKADAEARKAEARAKEAEAKAKEANTAKEQIFAKVKQEEQILDMEADEKKRKDADKEAKRLAKLARWQHEMGKEDSSIVPHYDSTEEEETKRSTTRRVSSRVSPHEVAKYILSRTK